MTPKITHKGRRPDTRRPWWGRVAGYHRWVIERLRAGAPGLFAGTPVRFAYLFGSYAPGNRGPA